MISGVEPDNLPVLTRLCYQVVSDLSLISLIMRWQLGVKHQLALARWVGACRHFTFDRSSDMSLPAARPLSLRAQ